MFLVSYHDKYPAVPRDIRYLDLYCLFDVYIVLIHVYIVIHNRNKQIFKLKLTGG